MALKSPFTVTEDGTKYVTRQSGDIHFLLGDCPRPKDFRVHEHALPRFSFLISGVIREVDDRKKSVERGPHTLHVTPAHMSHGHWIDTPRLTTLCFDVSPTMLQSIGRADEVFATPALLRSGHSLNCLTRLYREMLAGDTASGMILGGLAYEVVGEVVRRRTNRPTADPPAWLRLARELLRDRLNENPSIAEVAASVGVHPSYLTRMFRTYLHESPGEYVRRIRMERATKEVLLTDRPLKQIAESAGFSDQAHFSREFRRMHGESPMRLRQEVRR
jgi:AraC family transcriptional regulator